MYDPHKVYKNVVGIVFHGQEHVDEIMVLATILRFLVTCTYIPLSSTSRSCTNTFALLSAFCAARCISEKTAHMYGGICDAEQSTAVHSSDRVRYKLTYTFMTQKME